MPIKTFRGLLGDDAQERIRLETLDGKTGYRIKKFQIITEQPMAGTSAEHVVKVYSIQQTAIDGVVNFSEQTLLGVAAINNDLTGYRYGMIDTIIFDGVTFNQDIFVTHKDVVGNTTPCNYYLELEQIRLDDVEATAVILKNFRNTNTT